MGDARRKSRHRRDILAAGSRCIYCSNPADTIEHMPPVGMFRGKQRLSGMEFPCCEVCNAGTKAADAMASLMAHITPNDMDESALADFRRLLAGVSQMVPDFADEFTRPGKRQQMWVMGSNGLYSAGTKINADGPILKGHLDVFAAKLGMSLYREHIGLPLLLGDAVYSACFSKRRAGERYGRRNAKNTTYCRLP